MRVVIATEYLFYCFCRSKHFNDFLKKCLQKNPNDRATAIDLLDVSYLFNLVNIKNCCLAKLFFKVLCTLT